MPDYRKLISAAIKITTFLFAAFGGFLTRIAPPDQTAASYPVGIVSFLALIALLVISALRGPVSTRLDRRRWTTAGIVCLAVALAAAFLYPAALSRFTYWYPPEKPLVRHVQASADDLTDLARDYIRRNPTDTEPGELERNLPSDQIWTKTAIARANRILLITYTWLVLSLATSTFCLVEANSMKSRRPAVAAGRAGGVH